MARGTKRTAPDSTTHQGNGGEDDTTNGTTDENGSGRGNEAIRAQIIELYKERTAKHPKAHLTASEARSHCSGSAGQVTAQVLALQKEGLINIHSDSSPTTIKAEDEASSSDVKESLGINQNNSTPSEASLLENFKTIFSHHKILSGGLNNHNDVSVSSDVADANADADVDVDADIRFNDLLLRALQQSEKILGRDTFNAIAQATSQSSSTSDSTMKLDQTTTPPAVASLASSSSLSLSPSQQVGITFAMISQTAASMASVEKARLQELLNDYIRVRQEALEMKMSIVSALDKALDIEVERQESSRRDVQIMRALVTQKQEMLNLKGLNK